MRKAAAVIALAFYWPVALADTASASFSNLTLSGAGWGEVGAGVSATSRVPGSDPQGFDDYFPGLPIEPLQVTSGGLTALMSPGASTFLLTFDGSVPGSTYYGLVGLGSNYSGMRIEIAPGATVTLSADFSTSITRDSRCTSIDCVGTSYGELGFAVAATQFPEVGEFEYAEDNDGFSLYGSGTLARRLEASYTNNTDSWRYAMMFARISIEGTVAPIPEPSSYGLMALGLAVLGFKLKRSRRVV
jgi:hypothetical protein